VLLLVYEDAIKLYGLRIRYVYPFSVLHFRCIRQMHVVCGRPTNALLFRNTVTKTFQPVIRPVNFIQQFYTFEYCAVLLTDLITVVFLCQINHLKMAGFLCNKTNLMH